MKLCHSDLENIARSNLDPDIKMRLVASMIADSNASHGAAVNHQTNGGYETTCDTQLAPYSLADISSALHSTFKDRPIQQSTPNLKAQIHLANRQTGSKPTHHYPVSFRSMQHLNNSTLDSPELLRDAPHTDISMRRTINPESIVRFNDNKDIHMISPEASQMPRSDRDSPSYDLSVKEMLLTADDNGLHGDSLHMIQTEEEVDMPELGVDIEAWLDGRHDNQGEKDAATGGIDEDIARLQSIVLQR